MAELPYDPRFDPRAISPRNPAAPIPVTARRPESVPAVETPPPPAAPTPVTHVIYINAPAPLPAAPQLAMQPMMQSPPPVTNHYTTHHYAARTPRMAGSSGLGMASLALGIISCVICWIPVLGLVAVPIGAIGAVLGFLGVVVSTLFRRSSAGLPFAGVFVCCVAGGISIASTNSLPDWRQQLGKFVPAVAPGKSSQPVQAPPPLPPLPPLPDVSKVMPKILDSLPTQPDPSPKPAAAPPSSPTKSQSPAKPNTPAIPPADPAMTAAVQRLTAAEQAARIKAKQSPAYLESVQSVNEAKATLDKVRLTAKGGSFDLKDASETWMEAQNAANALVDRAVATDPDVIAARNAVAGLKAVK